MLKNTAKSCQKCLYVRKVAGLDSHVITSLHVFSSKETEEQLEVFWYGVGKQLVKCGSDKVVRVREY